LPVTLRAGALSVYLSLLHGSNNYATTTAAAPINPVTPAPAATAATEVASTTATANLLNLANISAFK